MYDVQALGFTDGCAIRGFSEAARELCIFITEMQHFRFRAFRLRFVDPHVSGYWPLSGRERPVAHATLPSPFPGLCHILVGGSRPRSAWSTAEAAGFAPKGQQQHNDIGARAYAYTYVSRHATCLRAYICARACASESLTVWRAK